MHEYLVTFENKRVLVNVESKGQILDKCVEALGKFIDLSHVTKWQVEAYHRVFQEYYILEDIENAPDAGKLKLVALMENTNRYRTFLKGEHLTYTKYRR